MTATALLPRAGAALAALGLAAGLMAAPGVAAAQPHPGYQPDGAYAYDGCRRSQVNRGTGGAMVGAGLGAVAGSSIAGHGAKTEGAVLGGLLGAIIGANVGKAGAACQAGQYDQSYAPPPPQAEYGYQQGGFQGYGYDYDEEEDYRAAPVAEGPSADSCTLAESPIYLPDGRVQKRFVRVCRDSAGRYQVVD